MCNFCSNKKDILSNGFLNIQLDKKILIFEYEAYSNDSSIHYDEEGIEIKYCPICGKKL